MTSRSVNANPIATTSIDLNTPKLGFGCMRLPLNNPDDITDIDMDQFKRMVDICMDAGCTYFDTAYVYHEGHSETALKEALVDRYPREAYTIATKCLAWAQPNAEAAKACLATSLERLGVDYVDYYLLHNVGGKRTMKFDEYGMWDFALEQKAAGKIKHVGFSIHDGADVLEEILKAHPEMEFVQLQVNYLDWEDPVVEARRCVEVAHAHNKPIIIMEPARGGRLAKLPARAQAVLDEKAPGSVPADWAYRFCYDIPGVVTVLSGMSTEEQTRENVACYTRHTPLIEEERALIADLVQALQAVPLIPCTNCGYCVKDCPQGIKIPIALNLLNLEKQVEDHEFVKGLYSWQTAEGRPSLCIECGTCEDMCPQSIDIMAQLSRAVDLYED